MSVRQREGSLAEICCLGIVQILVVLATVMIILKVSFHWVSALLISFYLFFCFPRAVMGFIDAIKKYFTEIEIDGVGVKQYYKKQIRKTLVWQDIYEIGVVERSIIRGGRVLYLVISKEPVDICDEKYLEMRGIYSKQASVVMLYMEEMYAELKKYYKKDVMHYKKGLVPERWDK